MSDTRTEPLPSSAYSSTGSECFRASVLTRGPWHPEHQHAGPPIALVCRAIERRAAAAGLTHLGRLTANLLRPVPIGELTVSVTDDYIGRNAAHSAARLLAGGKEVARFTALVQRENELALPEGLPGHPPPTLEPGPAASPPATMPFARPGVVGYGDLVENRVARGAMFRGPCAVWFRLRHPLLEGETPSAYQRVAVAADSGNGISAVLDIRKHVFVNSDLTIHLLRRPVGEWIALDARTQFGPAGCGMAESTLYDAQGLIGRAVQSLSVRLRGSEA